MAGNGERADRIDWRSCRIIGKASAIAVSTMIVPQIPGPKVLFNRISSRLWAHDLLPPRAVECGQLGFGAPGRA